MEQMDASEALSRWNWREDAALGSARSPGSESFESACSSPDSRSGSGGCEGYEGYGHKPSERQKPKVKMSMKRRMKASEREKLRMRSLAEALHQLRDYLPPVFSRRAQPLTKIQTLKLTIQYINQLSSILQQHDARARNSRERAKPPEEPGKTPRTRDVPTSSTCHWQD